MRTLGVMGGSEERGAQLDPQSDRKTVVLGGNRQEQREEAGDGEQPGLRCRWRQ